MRTLGIGLIAWAIILAAHALAAVLVLGYAKLLQRTPYVEEPAAWYVVAGLAVLATFAVWRKLLP